MNTPKIVQASIDDLNKVKGVLTLGFASDALLRWVFPDASSYLRVLIYGWKNFQKFLLKII